MKEAVGKVKSGDTLMVGGFLESGHPESFMKALLEDSSATDLTIISNDTGTGRLSCARLIESGRVRKIYASYIGGNKATGQMLMEKEGSVVLVPQGTLAEQIRAGGAGIGGFLTKTGLGTVVEEGKQVVELDGEHYLLEKAMRADVAVVWAGEADRYGNLRMPGSTKNFNAIMPAAAETTIAVMEKLVDVIPPEDVTVPGVYVDYLVQGGEPA